MDDRISLVWIFTFVVCSLSKECPSSWKRVNRQCFRLVNSLAYDSLGFPTVYHARQTCKQYGGDLAHIRDSYYENEAFSIIRTMPWDAIPRYVYIGLTDIRQTGQFEWLNQTAVGYDDWAPGEPNNGGESVIPEACVAVKSPDKYWSSPDATEWHDYPCCVQAYIPYALCSLDLDEEDLAANSNSSRSSVDILYSECNRIDECASNPCYHDGTCIDELMGYTCNCPFGFTGDHCQFNVTCPRRGLGPATVGIVIDGDPSEDQSLDSTLSVTCVKGYRFKEAENTARKRFNCTVNGWKLIEEPVEKVIRCPPIPTWKGLRTNLTDRSIDSFTNYSCQEDHKFNDSDTYKWSVCNTSGSWEPPLAVCVEKEPLSFQARKVAKPQEASGAVVVGTFGLIFLITEVVLVVLLDFNIYRKQFMFGYGNIKSWIKYRKRETQFHAVPN